MLRGAAKNNGVREPIRSDAEGRIWTAATDTGPAGR